MRRPLDRPTEEELQCLVDWPEGTTGNQDEKSMLKCLIALCDSQGFGRVHQMMNAIEEIWRDPKKVEKWKKLKTERFASLGWKE